MGAYAEKFYIKASSDSIGKNLARNGATRAEVRFIAEDHNRVELNAFTSRRFVVFLETKLAEQRVQKVIPDDETLQKAHRRSVQLAYIQEHFEVLRGESERFADFQDAGELREKVKRILAADPTIPWDSAVVQLAEKLVQMSAIEQAESPSCKSPLFTNAFPCQERNQTALNECAATVHAQN